MTESFTFRIAKSILHSLDGGILLVVGGDFYALLAFGNVQRYENPICMSNPPFSRFLYS